MNLALTTARDQLKRAYASFGRTRHPQEAVQTLRQVTDQARAVLSRQPEQFPDRHVRHADMHLRGYITLAEGSVRGHEPAAGKRGA